jgi:hypothetical protein
MTRKKISNKLPPFVPMTWKMLNSEAYKNLPFASAKILPLFIGKVQAFGFNDPARFDTSFEFTYSEAKKRLGYGRSTFYKVLLDLMRHGFVDPVKKGGFRSFGNTSSRFKLSRRWEDYEKFSFKAVDWKGFPIHPQVQKMDCTVPLSEPMEMR